MLCVKRIARYCPDTVLTLSQRSFFKEKEKKGNKIALKRGNELVTEYAPSRCRKGFRVFSSPEAHQSIKRTFSFLLLLFPPFPPTSLSSF